MHVFDETGTGWRVGNQIAEGGEGGVFRLPDRPECCVKLYHKRPLSAERVAKLVALQRLSPALQSFAAFPLSLVSAHAGSRAWIGVLLPFVEGQDIYELYNPQGRRTHFQHATFEFVLAAAQNLAKAFEALHTQGIILGDISEQNIRVRPDATLRLIDCDGMQLQADGRLFPSNLATPIWTPPELQGGAFKGGVRTRNHDAFGLAQLIFLLLFGGRYPFAGRPLSAEALSPEEAIAQFAFAFDPAPLRPLLEPPLGAPRLEALPPQFAQLFVRAFRAGSEAPEARPTPREWAEALGELRGELVRCSTWEAHVYWKGASHCAWCGVLEEVGVDLFPGPPAPRQQRGEHEAALSSPKELAQRLLSLHFEPLHLAAPSPALLQEAVQKAGGAAPAWWLPLARGLGPVGGALRAQYKRSLTVEWEAASRELSSFEKEAATLYLGYASALRALGQRLQQLGRELAEAAQWAEQAVERFHVQQRHFALKRYLETFLLRRYEIQGISAGKKAALLSHQIVTAADVTLEAAKSVPGITAPLAERLVRWRLECERGFRYVETGIVPETVRAEAREEGRHRIARLLQQGLACEAQWGRATLAYKQEHAVLQGRYQEAVKQRALLEAKLREVR